MARLDFCDGAYQSSNLSISAQELINMFFEPDESGQGKSTGSLLFTPGTALYTTIPGNSVPAGIEINGRVFFISGGGSFNELVAGVPVLRGNLPAGVANASLAASATQIMIAIGGQGYCFSLATNTLTAAIATIAGVVQFAYSDGFFLALIGNSEQFFVSRTIDGTFWDPAQTTIVSVFPGQAVFMVADHREIGIFGSRQSVFYYDSGNVFPFDVIPGSFMEQGAAASFGWSRADNSVFWWDQDERGGRMAYRLNQYTGVRISTHAIEAELETYPTISDAVSYSFKMGGHTFWQTTFPTADKTWVYDVSNQRWFRRSFRDPVAGVDHAHRSLCHVYSNGLHLVGDSQSGKIFQMAMPKPNGDGTWSFCDDFGNNIRRLRRAPYIANEGMWMGVSSFELEGQFGIGQNPTGGLPVGNPSFILADANGVQWSVSVLDGGLLQTTAGAVGIASTMFLRDNGAGLTCWQVKVAVGGLLTTTAVAFNPSYPVTFNMASTPGNLQTGLQVTAGGLLATVNPRGVPRAPVATLRWSDDRGATWSNGRVLNLGSLGQYGKRAITRMLGRFWGGSGRIFELSYSDKIPLRITDAYVEGLPDLSSQKRLVHQLRERA